MYVCMCVYYKKFVYFATHIHMHKYRRYVKLIVISSVALKLQ